ncbi:BppU family phage baseplate upper protein [Bacillus velezensis]|uniref:BppU family phage baseplate upper protein n=1 Tax=Bacillus velezensis TaxID=492670 RepID=UPI002DC470ED|nr:BppU family phage baseplate upper protein [Bacillus velezensis]
MNTVSQGTYRSAFKFSTQDVGTAKLIFNLRKDDAPLPLSAVTGKVILVPANGKKRVRDVTLVDKVNGIAEYVLDEDEIKMYGLFQCELVLVYSNKQAMSAHKFGFEVTQSLMDQDIAPVGEYYIDDFETLKAKVIEIYDSTIQTLDDLKKKFEDLENIETKQGAQEKADAVQANLDNHLNDKKNPHGVTKAQIGLSAVTNDVQAKKADFDKHTSDTSNPHNVTALQIGLGNVENIQQAAKSDFDDHLNDTNVHISKSDRDRWDAAQLSKITKDNGSVLINVSQGVDFQSVAISQRKTFTFYTAETGINTPPVPTRGMYLYSSSTYGEAIAFGNDGSLWRKSLSSGAWSDWVNYETEQGSIKRLAAHSDNTDIHVTKDDKDKWNGTVKYANIMLKNGATVGTRTPIYAKWGALLFLRGHVRTDPEIIFGSIPSSMVPAGGAVATVSLSGTGGTANLIIYDTGDLKIKYQDPADSSKAGGGYYLDVVVGLQDGGTA